MQQLRINIKDIEPNEANPRNINDSDFVALKRSLAQLPKMLFIRGIAVKRQGKKWVSFGGNMRTRALYDLMNEIGKPGFYERYQIGQEQADVLQDIFDNGVPCHDTAGMTDEEIRRFIIADNVAFGKWDMDGLANAYDVEELKQWGVDLPDWSAEGLGTDFSDKNKEIDVNDFSDLMELKFKFEQDVYNEVRDKLLSMSETIEEGLLKLLENVESQVSI